MVNFNVSFSELKKPMIWLHYALGTAGIFAIFYYLMFSLDILTASSPIWAFGIAFFISLVVVDRIIHKVLFNAPFSELQNPILVLHYTLDTIGIVAIWAWLTGNGYLNGLTIPVEGIIFLVIYVLIDRTSHGILELK
jgi:hypothetical protein